MCQVMFFVAALAVLHDKSHMMTLWCCLGCRYNTKFMTDPDREHKIGQLNAFEKKTRLGKRSSQLSCKWYLTPPHEVVSTKCMVLPTVRFGPPSQLGAKPLASHRASALPLHCLEHGLACKHMQECQPQLALQ